MKTKLSGAKQKIYFIGIKGVGMTMLAEFLKSKGHEVSGSDVSETFLTDKVLERLRIPVSSPFSPANIPPLFDKIIYSSAYNPDNNSELSFIVQNNRRFKNKKILSYAVALSEVFNAYKGIAVCGSHGKTTTTAWLGYVLNKAGLSPNVLVGSRVPQFKGSGLIGSSRYMVAEVDEYQDKTRFFRPRAAILNNIDYDHPDFFKTVGDYCRIFHNFVGKIPSSGWLVVNYDDREAKKAAGACSGRVISYSCFPKKNCPEDYQAFNIRQVKEKQVFRLIFRGRDVGEFSIKLFGRHNIANALAVIAAAHELKVSFSDIRRHLGSFQGTERRGQVLGEYNGAVIIDDYAHHPSEVRATLAGLRERWPDKRIITVFHPHTFSRTAALFKDFVVSFSDSDLLVVLDIYSSAREQAGRQRDVSGFKLSQAVAAFNKRNNIRQTVRSLPDLKAAGEFLQKAARSGDLVVLMGAGDVFRIGKSLLKGKIV